jgi:hypothetical protein
VRPKNDGVRFRPILDQCHKLMEMIIIRVDPMKPESRDVEEELDEAGRKGGRRKL